MPKFNPFTGALDYTGVPVKAGTTEPSETGPNGDVQVQFVSSEGRVYFRVNDKLYYVTGTEVVFDSGVNIPQGQPIGLMGVTYAEDVN